MDLFSHAMNEKMKDEAPLAARLRPRTLDEFVGQEHIIGPGKLLRRAIEADRLFSSIQPELLLREKSIQKLLH